MLLKKEIFTLPNIITMIRIGMVPFLFTLLLSPGKFWSLVLAIFFVLASLTDLIDGYIARKYSLVTTLGKFLDPMADKLIVNSAMILMIPSGRIAAWIVAIIIIRDFLVDGIRSIASTDGMYIQASNWGKKKTLAQTIAVTALIINYPLFGIDAHFVGTIILYVALFLTLVSGADYFIKYYRFQIKSNN